MPVAIVCAVAAGACFAIANLVQQHAARTRHSSALSLRLLGELFRNRAWLLGLGLVALSYAFQSVALSFGPLSLVQSIMISELLFTAPVSARLHHQHVGRSLLVGVGAVAIGLPLALVASSPQRGDPVASLWPWLLTVAAAGAVAVLGLAAWRMLHGVARASALAFSGAVVMGTQSALLAVSLVHLREGPVAVITAWQSYVLVVASFLGGWMIQAAYHEGPLVASVPLLDAGEPTVAVLIGVLVFGERVRTGALSVSLTVLGIVLVMVGIVVVDCSPTARSVARAEQQERDREHSDEPAPEATAR